jgi:hypothetical protein
MSAGYRLLNFSQEFDLEASSTLWYVKLRMFRRHQNEPCTGLQPYRSTDWVIQTNAYQVISMAMYDDSGRYVLSAFQRTQHLYPWIKMTNMLPAHRLGSYAADNWDKFRPKQEVTDI